MKSSFNLAARKIGIIEIILSGIAFGFLGVLGKRAYEIGFSPGEYLALRFSVAGTVLALWLIVAKGWKSFFLPKKIWLACVVLGTFGYALFSSLFFIALTGLSASLTVLLLYTYPVIVSVGAWVVFGERMGRATLIALPVVSVGLLALVWGEFHVREPWALLAGFGAAVFYSTYILASSRWLRGMNAVVSACIIMLSAGVVLASLYIRSSTLKLLVPGWPVILATALVSTLLAMSLFLSGLQKLKNSEVSVLSTSEPLTGVFLAFFVLGERLSLIQGIGGGLILAGMVLASRGRTRLEKARRQAEAI